MSEEGVKAASLPSLPKSSAGGPVGALQTYNGGVREKHGERETEREGSREEWWERR